ncbi:hypothetical protein CaCOL14_009852 [Colletotrichum acutatum]
MAKYRRKSVDAGGGIPNIDMSLYYATNYSISSFNSTDGGSSSSSGVYFNGNFSTCTVSDFGVLKLTFLATKDDEIQIMEGDQLMDNMFISDEERSA